MKIQLRTTKNKTLDIDVVDDDLINHFNNQDQCASFIINQINNEKIYDYLLENEDNLVIFDIGANVGLFSLHAHDRCEKIFAVEPTPSHFKKLEKLTAPYQNIIPVNAALSNVEGTMDFYISDVNPTQNSLISNWRSEDEQKITVTTYNLKSLFEKNNVSHVDLVKCDIEGGEIIALTKDTVGEVLNIVDSWFIELHQTDNSISHADSISKNMSILTEVFEFHNYKVQVISFDTIYCYKE